MIVPIITTLLLVAGSVQDGGRSKSPERTRGAAAAQTERTDKGEQLERWRSLDPAARAELTRRYEKLKSLSPEERTKLMERAERLQSEIEKTLSSLGPEERSRIEALEPRERSRVLRGLVGDRARVAASQLRGRLTDDQRRRLESASPAEREAMLRQVRERERASLPERLGQLGRELGLSDSEIRRIQRGTPQERRGLMIDVTRRRSSKYVEQHGLPEGISQRRWRSIAAGSDEEFVRGYLRIRARHPQFGVPPKRWEQREKRHETMASRLESFSRPTMEQRMRARGSKDGQLRRRVLLEQRSRVEDTIVRIGGLSREEAAKLRSLDDEAFQRAYRAAITTLQRGGELKPALERAMERRERGPRRRGAGRNGERRSP